MANSLNKTQIIGRLGKDVELRHTQNNQPVASLSVGVSEQWNDKSGNKQERTEWFSVVIWGKLAEVADKYLKKGSKVYLEGKMQTRKWTDNNGDDRYSTELVLNGFGSQMIMLDNAQGSSNDNQSQTSTEPDFDDSIPF